MKELELIERIYDDCAKLNLDYLSQHNLMADIVELKEALTELERLQNKEVPMKVKKTRVYSGYNNLNDGHKIMATNYNCPICDEHQTRVWDGSKLYVNKTYCDNCGQKLDWSDE